MENVPRVFEYDLFKRMLLQIERDYVLWKGVLNAALFGVPQTRQRAIVIGYRRDLGVEPTAPWPTHLGRRRVYEYATKRFLSPATRRGVRLLGFYPEVGKPREFWESVTQAAANASLADLVVVQDAIGDLPEAVDHHRPLSSSRNASPYAASLLGSEIHNHRRWRHRPDLLRRLRGVPEGGGLLDRFGRARARPYFSQAYTRLHRRGLARTITTNFHNPGSGRYLHYEALRTLTVREAARLQGIEDDFAFIGFQSIQERLVGNAFPVPLAEAIARHIAGELLGAL
jgi:DNA (cytosine-5)-methyltransferase 1